ncbi:hypothetical protein BHQ15_03150 [Mycolicibacillus koreensis]|nr:hypothetical protein BHQ15_03150 [Mycolicibacillus koreensis]
MSHWVAKRSPYPVAETMTRLENALGERGFTVMARIDHAAHAERAGQQLRPTEVMLFGKPALGTQLMQADQLIAIDLPSKVLGWQDADGQNWLGYRDLRALIAGRTDVAAPGTAVVAAELAAGIEAATDAAVRR